MASSFFIAVVEELLAALMAVFTKAFWGPRDTRTGNPPTTALIGILAPPRAALVSLSGLSVHTCKTRISAPL